MSGRTVRTVSGQNLTRILGDRHNEHAGAEIDCDLEMPHTWWDCEEFVLTRIKGAGNTVYLVPADEVTEAQVLDWPDGGDVRVHDGFTGATEALSFAFALALTSIIRHEEG